MLYILNIFFTVFCSIFTTYDLFMHLAYLLYSLCGENMVFNTALFRLGNDKFLQRCISVRNIPFGRTNE